MQICRFQGFFFAHVYGALEPQVQEMGEFYMFQKRRETDFEAPKLWKGRSGGRRRIFFYGSSQQLRDSFIFPWPWKNAAAGGNVSDNLITGLY